MPTFGCDVADTNRPRPASTRNLGDGDLGLWVAYEERHAAKALPGTRWDPSLKCWRIRIELAAEAEALIRRLNGGTDVVLAEAFATVFARLPQPLRQPAYRALAKVLHPDAGGDDVAAKALTQAWAEVQP